MQIQFIQSRFKNKTEGKCTDQHVHFSGYVSKYGMVHNAVEKALYRDRTQKAYIGSERLILENVRKT